MALVLQFAFLSFLFAVLQDLLEKRMIEVEGALLRLQEQFHKVSIFDCNST